MSEPQPGKPWAYIGHKDNHWAGVCAANAKGIGKFLADFVKDGFSIMTVHSRDEYNKALGSMKCWHEHPEYKAKNGRR